jgi:hypothetical protein
LKNMSVSFHRKKEPAKGGKKGDAHEEWYVGEGRESRGH